MIELNDALIIFNGPRGRGGIKADLSNTLCDNFNPPLAPGAEDPPLKKSYWLLPACRPPTKKFDDSYCGEGRAPAPPGAEDPP